MIRLFLNLYCLLIIVNAIVSYIPQWHNKEWVKKMQLAAEYTQSRVRAYLPPDLSLDISPLVVIVLIMLVQAFW